MGAKLWMIGQVGTRPIPSLFINIKSKDKEMKFQFIAAFKSCPILTYLKRRKNGH